MGMEDSGCDDLGHPGGQQAPRHSHTSSLQIGSEEEEIAMSPGIALQLAAIAGPGWCPAICQILPISQLGDGWLSWLLRLLPVTPITAVTGLQALVTRGKAAALPRVLLHPLGMHRRVELRIGES